MRIFTSPAPILNRPCPVDHWLNRFGLDRFIRAHVSHVIHALPPHVRRDLMDDPTFTLHDYDPAAAPSFQVPIAIPGHGGVSRCVVLKRTLRQRSLPFVHWLIAHELAHAHLRNDGRWPGDDPEHAADALAAQWGFPKPHRSR